MQETYFFPQAAYDRAGALLRVAFCTVLLLRSVNRGEALAIRRIAQAVRKQQSAHALVRDALLLAFAVQLDRFRTLYTAGNKCIGSGAALLGRHSFGLQAGSLLLRIARRHVCGTSREKVLCKPVTSQLCELLLEVRCETLPVFHVTKVIALRRDVEPRMLAAQCHQVRAQRGFHR